MSTLLEIKQACANYLNIAIGDLTQNGQDMFLVAVNQVRKMAELANDFEFSRKTVSLTVNGLTGGNLALARDIDGNLVEVKTVIEAGLLDTAGNLCPVEWTTTSESLTRQREDNIGAWPRYPTDDMARGTPYGGIRFTFSGDKVMSWPLASETNSTNYTLYLEGYTFQFEWGASNLSASAVAVAGTLIPDVTGSMPLLGVDASSYNFYTGTTPLTFLRQYGGGWFLEVQGTGETWFFNSASMSPAGSYSPTNGAVGDATVTLTTGTSDIWTTHGSKYLLWATLVQLNHIWRRWVARQEGNLPPPSQLAEEGLQALIAWDAYRFEGFRTHNR